MSNKRELRKKRKSCHPVEKPIFKCDYCQKTFRSKLGMTGHMKRFHNFKPYHCDQCDQKFEMKQQQVAHVKQCKM